MRSRKRTQPLVMLLGCGLLILMFVALSTGWLFFTFSRERHALRFPGSSQIPSLTTVRVKPAFIQLNNGYRSEAPTLEISNWYAKTFQLIVLEKDDACISLEGVSKGPAIQRRTNVTICDHAAARAIWISRFISKR